MTTFSHITQYTHRQFRSAHAQNTHTVQSCPWISSKDFLLDKTMAFTCALNNCSNGSYWLKTWEKLVNMYAFTQTTNVAVTLLSGKYSYLDSLWNRCTSYRNESGWVKSSLQSFVLFLGHFFLFLFHCLVYHEHAFMF